MSYQDELQIKEIMAAASVQESANRAAFSLICDQWPLAASEANFRMLTEWCNGEISVPKFEALINSNPEGFTLDFTGTRDKLLAEIANELDPNGTKLSQPDINQLFLRRARGESVRIDQIVLGKSRNIDTQLSKLAFATKAALRARLAELRYARAVRGKSTAELQGDLAAHRQSQQGRFHPFPTMPSSITPEELREAGRHKLTFLGHKYGQAQVNARLNGWA